MAAYTLGWWFTMLITLHYSGNLGLILPDALHGSPDGVVSMSYKIGKGIVPTLIDVVVSGATLKGDCVNFPHGWWIHRWLATNAKGRYKCHLDVGVAVSDGRYWTHRCYQSNAEGILVHQECFHGGRPCPQVYHLLAGKLAGKDHPASHRRT